MIQSSFFNLIVFLSAFLLFQLELIVAKTLLPHYGGSYLVWGSSVVFFQAVLLAGYGYAHYVVQKFGLSRYRVFHLILCLLPLFVFPGRPFIIRSGSFGLPLFLDVFVQLAVTIGPVFFVLSTMSVLMQVWFSRSSLPQAANPYPLYAVSNFGSFAALLTYPFLFEAQLTLSQQLRIWQAGYFIVVFLQIIIIWIVKLTESREGVLSETSFIDDIEPLMILRYFFFGAAGVVLFLSVTNVMTTEIAPIPLLWVVPLSIYLLAFVFNFKKFPWCPAWIVQKIHLILAFSSLLYFFMQQKTFPAIIQLILFCAALFILCMFCQNQLRVDSPRQKQHLTIFYVVVSSGGLAGGLIVSWIIPLISICNIEYLIGLVLISFAITLKENSAEISRHHLVLIVNLILFLIFWPIIFKHYSFLGLIFIVLVVRCIYLELAGVPAAVNLSLIIILCCAPFLENFWVNQKYVYRTRNYYGIYRIFENQTFRFFTHGTTLHGAQSLIPGREPEPLTYFSLTSPVGEILTSRKFQFKQIGIIGLGTGTLSAYLQPGQTLDFFELDGDVYDIAQRYFTFLSHAAGRIRYFFGDARLSLDKIPDSYYDVFIVDAFSGDAIPTHLITQEAILNMRRHLKNNGIILLHISNRYLQLEPVLAKTAESLNVRACFKFGYPSGFFSASQWAAMTWDENAYRLLLADKWEELPPRDYEHLRAWSDDYSNVLPILKLEDMRYSFKDFHPFHL